MWLALKPRISQITRIFLRRFLCHEFTQISTNNLLVEIDGANTTEIALNALSSGDSLTGSISVTLDWTEAANMEGVVKEVVGKYPLNIKFFYAEDYSANNYAPSYSQLGETLVVPVGTTTAHYEMSGIPVTGKGIGYFGVYYTVEETEYLLLTLGSDIIQIYSQQVSIPDNGDLYVITNNNIPSVINEVRLNLSYGEDPTKAMIDILNNYKGSKGRKYKSDYLTIRGWVKDKYYEDLQRYGTKINGGAVEPPKQTVISGYHDTL